MAQGLAIAAQHRPNWQCVAAMTLLVAASGCSYESFGTIDQHYSAFGVRTPENNRIFVCSAYGCSKKTGFRFTPTDITTLQLLMAEPGKSGGPAEERQKIASTLAWMEKRVGDVVGTSADRPGDDLAGMGDPTQMDCVDVATNLTSYLLILERHQLLKYHTVGSIFVKEDLRRGWDGWPHYAAIVLENQSKQRYAVDGWKLPSGIPPEIVEAERWYIDDADIKLKTRL